MDHPLQLKYQRNYSIIINDCDVSLFYYFDYGERYKQINMEFQHSHRFHEITIPLSPDTTHFIEGVPYSLEEGDIVLLQPTILHRTEYPAGPPSKRLIISFWYPKDLFGMADYYLPLLSILYRTFVVPLPPPTYKSPVFQSFAFKRKYENRFWALSMKFIRFQDITTIWLTQNSGLSFTRCLYSFCMQLSKTRIKIYIPISRQATQQRKKSTALLIIYTATMMRNCRLIPWLTDSF